LGTAVPDATFLEVESSGQMRDEDTSNQDLYPDLVRLHILHHACESNIFGSEMIEELGRHGYRVSPGTIYPLLHSLEERGLLVSKDKQEGKRYRRFYRATPNGRKALQSAKKMVLELVTELFESPSRISPRKAVKPRR
jgi:DNA-binding PadR family transcriptional regulator